MALFVGRLPSSIKEYDLEDIFLKYGKLTRCDIKKGKSFSYGFVEFDNEDDAYDAIDDVDGRDLDGVRIVVEKAKGHVRRSDERGCYNCGEEGHYARDCRERSRRRYRSPSRSPSRSRRYRRYSRSPSPQRRRHRHNSYSRSPSYHRRRSYSASVSRSPSQRRRRRDYSSYSRSRSQSPGERSYSRSFSVDERRHGDARSPPSATRDDEGSVLETPDVNQVPASTTATPFATPTDAAIIED